MDIDDMNKYPNANTVLDKVYFLGHYDDVVFEYRKCFQRKVDKLVKINMNNKVLVLGDGLLGSEVVKQTGWDYVSRKGWIRHKRYRSFHYLFRGYDVILNAIANTDTYSRDTGI
jgi:hypothetical protein